MVGDGRRAPQGELFAGSEILAGAFGCGRSGQWRWVAGRSRSRSQISSSRHQVACLVDCSIVFSFLSWEKSILQRYTAVLMCGG